jgi:sensor histidine kinase YesM
VRIGGKNGIVVCDRGRAPTPLPPVVPTPPTSGPVAATSDAAPATPATKRQQPVASNPDDDDDEDEPIRKTVNVTRTLGGWIGDLLSALLIAFFAYLVASKVIVRHSAEADARVRVATDSAEREAMERQLVQARLKLLQAQVEPHFLFNTLAAVDYLIETDPSRASVMQKTLIAYLRAALPQMRQDSSTLGQEITLVRHYLELLKLRIEDRLRFEIAMPTGLASAIFPPLVLQTLVENAIKHGIEPKPEGGLVRVQAEVSDGQLCVDVIDTGVGLPQGGVRGPSGNGNGLGLDNIRARLEMLYPQRSRLELSSGAAGETRAHVSIPYQTDSTKSKT